LLGLLASFSAAAAEPQTLCEADLAHQAFLLKYRESQFSVSEVSRVVVVQAENSLLLVQRNCNVIDEETYKTKALENHALLLEMLEAEFRVGSIAREEVNAAAIAALDLKWQMIAISTLEYCQQKFAVLVQNRQIARGRFAAGSAARSALLEAELGIQKHREFCSLEGSIELPPVVDENEFPIP